MTNEEKLKSMSTREMAVWLMKNTYNGYCRFCADGRNCTPSSLCLMGVCKWLESEVADDGRGGRDCG